MALGRVLAVPIFLGHILFEMADVGLDALQMDEDDGKCTESWDGTEG